MTDDRLLEQVGRRMNIAYAVERRLFSGASEYQSIDAVRIPGYGQTLFLDGIIQTAESDEFIYHESLVHPATLQVDAPRRVLVVGGGDGGAVRQLLRYPTIEQVILAELDTMVIDVARAHLDQIHHGALDDPRLLVEPGDARQTLASFSNELDVVIIDLTEPTEAGPSQLLFTQEFYELAAGSLNNSGVLAIQTSDAGPTGGQLLADVTATVGAILPRAFPYLCPMPSFFGLWSFVIAGRDLAVRLDNPDALGRLAGLGELQYLNADTLAAGQAVPPFLQARIARGKVRTDELPFIWTE